MRFSLLLAAVFVMSAASLGSAQQTFVTGGKLMYCWTRQRSRRSV
jgi:hypothetical protein